MNNQPLTEYQTPEIYDAEYGQYQGDFEVFIGIKTSGVALDLACGTGRITIALANSGLICIGLSSEAMLARAKNKSNNLNISYIQGDMCNFSFTKEFELITMAGNSFQALLTDKEQDQMLSCVTKHLSKEGIFIFNTRNLNSEELKTTDNFEFWHNFTDFKGNIVKVFGKQIYDPSKQTVEYITKRAWSNAETITKIELRFTSFKDLKIKLENNGLEIIKLYGDVTKQAFTEGSKNIIILAKKAGCTL